MPTEQIQRQISRTLERKGRRAVEKRLGQLTRLRVEYVAIDSLRPNQYNPNRQNEREFELLIRSIEEDGFTQPILVQRDTNMIVDGEHRWRAAAKIGFDTIPAVFVDMSEEQMRVSTLRHNRARGSEDLELTVELLRDLETLGGLSQALDSLMLDEGIVNALLDDVGAPEGFAADDYSEAWVPGPIGDNNELEDREWETSAGRTVSGYSGEAKKLLAVRRELEEKATTEQDRKKAHKHGTLYRVRLTYSGEQAVIIREALGADPVRSLLDAARAMAKAQNA